jgi:hypothetical protein
MKIGCFILGTSKNIDRLQVLCAGAISSRSKKHKIVMNFTAEGPRPDFLPKSWNWIPADHIKPGHRHVYALIKGIANDKYDYAIFCDDDVLIDIDLMVEKCDQYKDNPTVITAYPGGGINAEFSKFIEQTAEEYIKGRNVQNTLWIGYCTSIANKKMLQLVRKDKNVLNKLMIISEEIHSQGGFYPDVQLSILAWLLEGRVIAGSEVGCTCWGTFGASRLLYNNGKQFHSHHTTKNPLVSRESLIEALKKPRHGRLDKLFSTLHPFLNINVKLRDWMHRPVTIGTFWTPWYVPADLDINAPKLITQFNMISKGKTNQGSISWSKTKNGFVIHNVRNLNDIKFQWHYKECAIGHMVRKNKIADDQFLESELYFMHKL